MENRSINREIRGIYKIQSTILPERIYIGSSLDITSRWRTHLCYLRNKKHPVKKLQEHCNKYGLSDLQFTIILTCDRKDLLNIEQYYLDSHYTYFNNCKIARRKK